MYINYYNNYNKINILNHLGLTIDTTTTSIAVDSKKYDNDKAYHSAIKTQ